MAARRRYTAKQKANAVGIATIEGVTEAERQTGIPKETIHYWLDKPEFAQLRTTAREPVEQAFWVGIQVGLEQVVAGLQGDAPLKDKATALGTLYDRHALMTGGATGRTESRDLTDSLDDHEKAQLRDILDSIEAEEASAADEGEGPR